ncbi:hypothetical protein GEO21_04895 [Sphingobacterium faecium]|uniref:hypothetical protein n=1 Tax=Sphingobacterium faecium TaxID=34087 RepID=UPI001291A590|nr:hypothetical protein [Sphingobacterium faecium]MQP26856.1 hypothetical protein [Sphingobacterium faecium]
MKPVLTLFIFIAMLISSCSKDRPEPEIPKTKLETISDEIRTEYIEILPELRNFRIILQDYNAIRDYIILYVSNDTKIFVAYLDQKHRTVKYKKIIDAPGELTSKFLVQRIGVSAGNQEENHSATIYLGQKTNFDQESSEQEDKSIGAVIIFPKERELSHVLVSLNAPQKLPPYFSEIRFTHDKLYYCTSQKVFMVNKANLQLQYSGAVVELLLEEEPIRSYYFEDARVVVLYRVEPGKLIVECGDISNNNFKKLWKHELFDWQPVKGEIKRSDYTFGDDQSTVFLQYTSFGNRYENGSLVKYSEKELYRYNKDTGR